MRVVDPLHVQTEIEALVDDATGPLTLVTPYFKPWTKLGERLLRHLAQRRGELTLVVRKDEPKAREQAATYLRAGARVLEVAHLHAKIYISPSRAIITSMNLYDASRESEEIAVLFEQRPDEGQYREVRAIVDGLEAKGARIDASAAATARAASAAHGASAGAATRSPRERGSAKRAARTPGGGTCIRCGDDVALNPDRPLCRDCYQEWARYENPDYEESFCHQCGSTSATSVARPLCRACWRAGA